MCVYVFVCVCVGVVVFVCALVVTLLLLLGCTDLTEKYNLMLGVVIYVVVAQYTHTLTPSNSRMPLPEVLMSGSVFKSSTRSLTSSSD